MQKRKRNRLLLLLIGVASIAAGVALVLNNLSSNIMFFYKPSELHSAAKGSTIKVGGIVKPGSIKQKATGLEFVLTDNMDEVVVIYHGSLPPMFKEKQGMIAKGKLNSNKIFYAESLLTKHDENYMPRELK